MSNIVETYNQTPRPFRLLEKGDCFIAQECVCIKILEDSATNTNAINLVEGARMSFNQETLVVPLNKVTITKETEMPF